MLCKNKSLEKELNELALNRELFEQGKTEKLNLIEKAMKLEKLKGEILGIIDLLRSEISKFEGTIQNFKNKLLI